MICLVIMARNEEPIITRALASGMKLATSCVLVDTGSTDATKQVAREWMERENHPYGIVDRVWKDFGSSRTEALQAARYLFPAAEWLLMLDADDTLEMREMDVALDPGTDGYMLPFVHGTSRYYQVRLFNAKSPWRYSGVTHEFPEMTEGTPTLEKLEGLRYIVGTDSHRRQSGTKASGDAALLLADFAVNPSPRTAFYLAQSYRDAGENAKAIEWYVTRSKMAGWNEETFFSLLQLGVLLEKSGREHAAVGAFLEAHACRPTRAEPLLYLARLYKARGKPSLWCLFAREAAHIPRPGDLLFVDEAVYNEAPSELVHALVADGRWGEVPAAIRALPDGEGKLAAKNAFETFCARMVKGQET
jgi:hypothetical protein